MKIWIVLLSFLVSAVSFAEIGKNEFENIKSVSESILSKYPKNEYVYVGLDRSPTPIIAYLQTEDGTLVRNLPLSGISDTQPIGETSILPVRDGSTRLKDPGASQRAAVFARFEEFIPKDSELQGRSKILLIDFVREGSGAGIPLVFTQKWLQSYLEDRRVQVEMFGLATQEAQDAFHENPNLAAHQRIDFYTLRFSPTTLASVSDSDVTEDTDALYLMMHFGLYQDVSPFWKAPLNEAPHRISPANSYENFVLEMKLIKTAPRLVEGLKKLRKLNSGNPLESPIQLSNRWINTFVTLNYYKEHADLLEALPPCDMKALVAEISRYEALNKARRIPDFWVVGKLKNAVSILSKLPRENLLGRQLRSRI